MVIEANTVQRLVAVLLSGFTSRLLVNFCILGHHFCYHLETAPTGVPIILMYHLNTVLALMANVLQNVWEKGLFGNVLIKNVQIITTYR